MEKFNSFLVNTSVPVSITLFILNLVLTVILCFVLKHIFIRYSHTLSNKGAFARNFLLIGPTTMIIITIVKTSLALSLGLVGALSIVRFRSAIKEPEELAYLFICIAIGLGAGANQSLITIVGTVGVLITIVVTHPKESHINQNSMILSLKSEKGPIDVTSVIRIITPYTETLLLKRYSESKSIIRVIILYRVFLMITLKNLTIKLKNDITTYLYNLIFH